MECSTVIGTRPELYRDLQGLNNVSFRRTLISVLYLDAVRTYNMRPFLTHIGVATFLTHSIF
jgi:hypothetical protein